MYTVHVHVFVHCVFGRLFMHSQMNCHTIIMIGKFGEFAEMPNLIAKHYCFESGDQLFKGGVYFLQPHPQATPMFLILW